MKNKEEIKDGYVILTDDNCYRLVVNNTAISLHDFGGGLHMDELGDSLTFPGYKNMKILKIFKPTNYPMAGSFSFWLRYLDSFISHFELVWERDNPLFVRVSTLLRNNFIPKFGGDNEKVIKLVTQLIINEVNSLNS